MVSARCFVERSHTVNNATFVEHLARQYDPQLPVDRLVIEMNRLFHRFEAGIYDTKHREIYERLPAIWQEMSEKVIEYFGATPLRILDFGCGTGFATRQLLQNIPASSIAALTCYDPSPEMLEQCRAKIAALYPAAVFCSSLQEAASSQEPYTLLLTNSVLHHLPDIPSTMEKLLPLLASHAMWLAGHEPSLRFYKNSECLANLEAYLRQKRKSPRHYARVLKRFTGRKSDLYTEIAREAVRAGLFRRQPSELVVDRIVDFHVAHSTGEISVGRGFDFAVLQQDFQDFWKLAWVKTYAFMGAIYEGELKGRWAASCRELARRFPLDGANFCTVWQRI